MDLSQASTDELRAELNARTNAQREAEWESIRKQHPCPECGADPMNIESEAVEEFRFAPRDDEGRPMLYAPYEMGTTNGLRWQITLTCVNGHVTTKDEIRWFDKPREGPPMLPR